MKMAYSAEVIGFESTQIAIAESFAEAEEQFVNLIASCGRVPPINLQAYVKEIKIVGRVVDID